MAKGIEKVGNVIKALAALLALFPGIAMILGLVDIPPTIIQLVQIISFSVSLIVLISVFLLRDKILAMSNNRAAVTALLAVVLGAICLTGYYQFANSHTVVIATDPPNDRHHIVPLYPSAEIQSRVAPFGDDYEEALRMSTQRDTLKLMMKGERATSVILMILLLVLSQVLLVAPVVGAAWKLAGAPALGEDDEAPKPRARRR